MIKNIVFDLGNVLIDFKPQIFLAYLGFNEEDIKLFNNIVFAGKEWNMYNQSKYDANEVHSALINNYPEYTDKINTIFQNIDYNYILFLKHDVSDYLKELKKQRFNIYILSDLSVDSYNHNRNFKFFNYIDGGVYSFEIGSTKPNKANYLELLNKYNLIANETIFIDDKIENVEAANKVGIHGIQFISLDSLKDNISKLI